MILPYQELMARGLKGELISPFDPELVNPASIDIRIGNKVIWDGHTYDISKYTADGAWYLAPKDFVLVETLEVLKVPLDCAMDLRLKSSRARAGYDHALAFWFDPGWEGIGTMEIVNNNTEGFIPIYPGLRIGQVIYHRLTATCEKPYQGRYQGATSVEGAKHGN